MKLAIFLPNWVGDACLAIPALRAFRQGLTRDARLVGIARPGPAALLADQAWIDDWLVYRTHATSPLLNRRRLITELHRHRCDAAILMTNSWSSAAMAAISRIPRRIGYARDVRSWLLTNRLFVPMSNGLPRPISPIDYYLEMAHHFGCPSSDRQIELKVNPNDLEQANQLWTRIGFTDRSTVVVNNNAANNCERIWPEEYVVSLVNKLIQGTDLQVLLHCGPNEVDRANRLADQISHSRVQSMGRSDNLPIGLSLAIFARASVVVTTDSGARHLAVAMNRPVISLFGPTQPAWTTTYNVPETILEASRKCEHCQKRPSSNNRSHVDCQCMLRIEPDRVYLAVLDRIGMNRTLPIQAA